MGNLESRFDDPELAKILAAEQIMQDDSLLMIASANHPLESVIKTREDAANAGFEGTYHEGYPDKDLKGRGRYYQGQRQADQIEELARKRALAVFAPENREDDEYGVNVQAPSGAILNLGVYLGIANPGDKILAPSLSKGYGHLSHGADSPSHIGNIFDVKGYEIDPETGLLDYDQIRDYARTHKPRIIIGGASSYPRDINWEIFQEIADEIGAIVVADIAHPAGLIAADLLNNPLDAGVEIITFTTHKTLGGVKGATTVYNKKRIAEKLKARGDHNKLLKNGSFNGIDQSIFPKLQGGPHMPTIAAHAKLFAEAQTEAFRTRQVTTLNNAQALAQELQKYGWQIATNGTDNHIVLLTEVNQADKKGKLYNDGWDAAIALEDAGIIVNKNAVPGTQGTPVRPAGLRFGTPALTARGFNPEEIRTLTGYINTILTHANDKEVITDIRKKTKEMARKHPRPNSMELPKIR